MALSFTLFTLCQGAFAFEINQDVSWEHFDAEKQKSKLRLDCDVFPEFCNQKAFEKSEFDFQMYLNAAITESNISGPDSAATVGYLLDAADFLYRRRSSRFPSTVSYLNERIKKLNADERNKVVLKIFWFLMNLCHEEEEVGGFPLVQTLLDFCGKDDIPVKLSTAHSLFRLQAQYSDYGRQVAPDGRREILVLLLTRAASKLFDKLDPHSSDAVHAHERLAVLFEERGNSELAVQEFLYVSSLNDRNFVGEMKRTDILLRLMKAYNAEHRYSETASIFQKHQELFKTLQSATQVSEIVSSLLSDGAYNQGLQIASKIFPYFEWNGVKTGVGGRHHSFYPFTHLPSYQLRAWMDICKEQGRTDMAKYLYKSCLRVAKTSHKDIAPEFSNVTKIPSQLGIAF